jgi:hypothetical protein
MTKGLYEARGSAMNRVKIGGYTELLGDPDVRIEKPHTVVGFPGGHVEIARTSDGNYWIHVAVRTDHTGDGDASPAGRIVRARIDADARYANEANAVLNAELERADVNHIAFLVRPGTKS